MLSLVQEGHAKSLFFRATQAPIQGRRGICLLPSQTAVPLNPAQTNPNSEDLMEESLPACCSRACLVGEMKPPETSCIQGTNAS